jgi:superfamily II DNA or RNA helicase/diadenosine tetraphosphate (Ap4A) HIT family hydrolase/HKD family nuclease
MAEVWRNRLGASQRRCRQDGPVTSPFLEIAPSEWIAENSLAFAIHDRYPVSPGHALVIPRRQIPDWWTASREERIALLDLVDEVKGLLDGRDPRPDGYNVGFNAGDAAGQTVHHLHVHVIPRYVGDMADPRGGVRHVIPSRGNYLAPPRQLLYDGPQRPLAPVLTDAFADPEIDDVRLAVSFVLSSGLRVLDEALLALLSRPDTTLRLLTSDYLDVTEPTALRRLLADQQTFPGLQVRLFLTDGLGFHPKSYLVSSRRRPGLNHGFVGSANLSRSGLESAIEWTLRTADAGRVDELVDAFEGLWTDPRAHPLTEQLIADYEARRVAPQRIGSRPTAAVVLDDPLPAPTPTPIQREAMTALEQSRASGFGAGLVVLATGLGKTWLAAFDSSRPHFGRLLFLAHREELLRQAMAVFRLAQPSRTTGLLMAGTDESHADVVFASLPTLVRRLDRYRADEFDYIVVDEFHHAAAATYRRVLHHFRPKFLLGLTATPDRTDGADLLALCDDNLVFEVGLVDGIRRESLVPFRYYGVADTIDFDHIPWRNARFDPETFENAALTDRRSQLGYDAWARRRRTRSLAFCVSVRHADHQAAFYRDRGVRAVAVHTGPSSAPRHQAIADLRAGKLDVLFSVDLFNEGLDVPDIDTVLMLRPTTSPVLFLQQLGRGLRSAPGKDDLVVIDFVGNHRSFLNRPQELLRLAGGDTDPASVRRAVETGEFGLPPGCSVEYEVEAVDLLSRLTAERTTGGTLERFIRAVVEAEGARPTALAAYRRGYNPAVANGEGGWHALLDRLGLLVSEEGEASRAGRDFLGEVAKTPITKAYKMVVLRALVLSDSLFAPVALDELSRDCQRLVRRDPRLTDDLRSKELPAPEKLPADAFARYWRKWPLAAWAGELSGAERAWARIEDGSFRLRLEIPERLRPALTNLVAELVDWRLAAYLDRKTTVEGAVLKVSHAGGRPILFLERERNPDLPMGSVEVVTPSGHIYEVDFVKVAVNVARRGSDRRNQLPHLLRSWFGDDAGLPGTAHRVRLDRDADGRWHLNPLGGETLPTSVWTIP